MKEPSLSVCCNQWRSNISGSDIYIYIFFLLTVFIVLRWSMLFGRVELYLLAVFIQYYNHVKILSTFLFLCFELKWDAWCEREAKWWSHYLCIYVSMNFCSHSVSQAALEMAINKFFKNKFTKMITDWNLLCLYQFSKIL